jgi:hypothetical protein
MAMTLILDACSYFSTHELAESSLLRFRMHPIERTLDVVAKYAADELSAYFAFQMGGGDPKEYQVNAVDLRLFRFEGTREFAAHPGRNVSFGGIPENDTDDEWLGYEKLVLGPGTRLITGVDCERHGLNPWCRMYLDSFGYHEWIFHQLLVFQKTVKVSRQYEKSQYLDAVTGETVDPRNPFLEVGSLFK